jgi:hypothetical protein
MAEGKSDTILQSILNSHFFGVHNVKNRLLSSFIILLTFSPFASNESHCHAGIVFGNNGLSGGYRWDAAPRTVGGLERSLDGGLRYSLQGGGFQAYRDSFSWLGTAPTVSQFQSAVEAAFNAWTVPDPVSQLTSAVRFVSDFSTTVDANVVGSVRLGAEIDLFATNLGDNGTRGFASFNVSASTVTLTSGVSGYSAFPITGADVTMNASPGALYTLDVFRRILTHEIGHTIGLGDVEADINPQFIDDNYDGSSSASALETLTNSWTHLVNPSNPSLSPLAIYNVSAGDPGVGTPGVNILMESRGVGIAAGNPVTNLFPLTNDDYGMRQFLYPSITAVPEASSMVLLAFGFGAIWGSRVLFRRPFSLSREATFLVSTSYPWLVPKRS